LGGTTLDGQNGLESLASILIVPPNGAGGGGRYLPSIVVVALGEPGVPVVCWAKVEPTVRARMEADNINARMVGVEFMVRLPWNDCSVARTSLREIAAALPKTATLIDLGKLSLNPCARLCDFGRKRIIAL
jgi:hypothetical protein